MTNRSRVDIFVDPNAAAGLSEQIYEQLRSGVLSGRLAPGDRLPPSREVAEQLDVSRSTVTTAYGRLSAEGFVDGRRGGGTFVSDLFADTGNLGREEAPVATMAHRNETPGGFTYDLRLGRPDPGLFPAQEWKRCLRAAVDQRPGDYGDPAGDLDTRRVLARWIGRSRGVETGPAGVVLTSGAQHALYLTTTVLLDHNDVVAVEDPGYPPFRQIAAAAGAKVAPVPVDEEGIIVDAIPEGARIVYTTPSHQFPTGVTMSMRRRVELLAMAQRQRMVIIEDDYDSEYRHVDRPLEPLHRLDASGHVVYVGSFSKTLSPALRLGFAVAPGSLLRDLVDFRHVVDWAPSAIDQLALRGFIADGYLDRHLRRTRRIYRRRHAELSLLLHEAERKGLLRAMPSNAGLHLSALLTDLDESVVLAALGDRGVAAQGLTSYAIADTHPGLALGFGTISGSTLTSAIGVIRAILYRANLV